MPNTFVDLFLQHTALFESPTSFWKWAAYSSIAAVSRDHISFRYGDTPLYPNIYVLLLAKSAVHRKGKPIKLAERLVKSIANTKIVSGRASVQAILDELGRRATDKLKGELTPGGSAIFFAEELSAAIVADPQAVAILTDLYDFKQEYSQHLKGSGRLNIDKIVFSMFAASNEDLLRNVYDASAMKGGLLGRTFLVTPSENRPPNSLFRMPDMSVGEQDLQRKLKEISTFQCEMKISDDAIKVYEDWYNPFYKQYVSRNDNSGVIGRIHTGITKLAMILAVNDLSSIMLAPHMEKAIDECLGLIPNYSALTMAEGKSSISNPGAIFLQALYSQPQKCMSRVDVIRFHWVDIDTETLDKIITTFETGGLIRTELTRGQPIMYHLTERAINYMGGLKNGS